MATKYREILSEISTLCETFEVWVPGHRDIPANCVANELARRYMTYAMYLLNLNSRWQSKTTCNMTRQIGPLNEINSAKSLLILNLTSISITIGIITAFDVEKSVEQELYLCPALMCDSITLSRKFLLQLPRRACIGRHHYYLEFHKTHRVI